MCRMAYVRQNATLKVITGNGRRDPAAEIHHAKLDNRLLSARQCQLLSLRGGKGACDRKAATIKSHMRVFLNSGNDIETPEQMFKAMVSFGGVPSLNVTLCEPFTSVETTAFKIDVVSLLSNIEYSAEGDSRAEGVRNRSG
ncbi:uncharacterized protein [Montipora capricornis]|uniref:uncharacterized protein n=1 Tax=Montipora capricornis TaxID=246305 RepID=UPI0035F161F2